MYVHAFLNRILFYDWDPESNIFTAVDKSQRIEIDKRARIHFHKWDLQSINIFF